jgi:acetolactate decarboxylase
MRVLACRLDLRSAGVAGRMGSGLMSELEFLNALHVDLLRHDGLSVARSPHELFQTSTIQALLGGAFDGDVTLNELLEHGDLGLGTLNALDGELIVIDGKVFKAELDCTLSRPDLQSQTPYAVVVAFTPGPEQRVSGPISAATLERRLWRDRDRPRAPTAIRIDGRFGMVRLRSVPKQVRPYPTLSEAIGHQHQRELHDISGTLVGFCFPDGLAGIEIVGFHLHFACDQRLHGGHALDYTLRDAVVRIDQAAELHVELPAAVNPPDRRQSVDQSALRRLESSS